MFKDLTDARSARNQKAVEQGIANMVIDFFGGMADSCKQWSGTTSSPSQD